MPVINNKDVREVLLEVIRDHTSQDWNSATMQIKPILTDAAKRLEIHRDKDVAQEQVLLTEWYKLFRTGYLSWGYSLGNPDPPWCHPTARGAEAIEIQNRDPSNPRGYLAHLNSLSKLNAITTSYLNEALVCYTSTAYKAAAVMIGAAAEAVILESRDVCVARIARMSGNKVRGLEDWKLKTILNSIRTYLENEKNLFTQELRDEYIAYWSAFTQ